MLKLKKYLLLTVLAVAAVFVLASCASQKVGEAEYLPMMRPDSGLVYESPIADSKFGDELVFDIIKPDMNGSGDPDDEASEDTMPSESETEAVVPSLPETDSSETAEQAPSSPDGEDAETNADDESDTDIGEDGGTDTEVGDDDVFDPDVEIGDNSEAFELYDVPLPAEKQYYVIQMAKEFDIPPELIFGVMYVETRYTETAISSNGKYIGMMQIAKSNLKMLNKKFGITDLTDYLQNVKAGAYFLSYFNEKYDGDIDKILMCYHRGEGGAKKKWAEGVMQDGYCRKVRKEIDRILAAM